MKPLLLALSLAGCHPKPFKPQAQLVIPASCIDKVRGTDLTKCTAIPGKPDWADCGNVVVHFTCTKVVPK